MLATHRIVGFLLLVLSFAGLPSVASAVMLEFSPQLQTVNLTEQATVDVFVSETQGNLVGAYDFFVDYDPTILQFDTIAFDGGLGGDFDALQDGIVIAPGALNASALSFLFDLSGLQDGVSDLPLFSLTFDAIGAGTSTLSFRENILGVASGFLGDDFGAPIALEGTGTAQITVAQPVPEPGTGLLLGATLVLLGLGRRLV